MSEEKVPEVKIPSVTIKAGSLYNGVLFGVGVAIPEYDVEIQFTPVQLNNFVDCIVSRMSEMIDERLKRLPQEIYEARIRKTNEKLLRFYQRRGAIRRV